MADFIVSSGSRWRYQSATLIDADVQLQGNNLKLMNCDNLKTPVFRIILLTVLLFSQPIVLDIPDLHLPPVAVVIMLFWSSVALSIAAIIEFSSITDN